MNCINGNSGNNNLMGDQGKNCINGKGGNDRIVGKKGNDTLRGGSGADEFIFKQITQIQYLGNKRYLVKSKDGNDIIQDYNKNAGDLIFNRKKNGQLVVYNVGNTAPTPGGGGTPGGDATVIGGSIDLGPMQDLIGGATPFDSEPLGISEGRVIILDSQKNPQIPFRIINPSQGFDGNQVVVFSITPTSDFQFQEDVVVVSTTLSDELKSIQISSTQQNNDFKQVIVVVQDAEAPEESLQNGTDLNDLLVGSSGDDLIQGLEGDDTLRGREGDDIVLGGAGDDRLVGGDGADSMYGNADRDRILGNDGDDRLNGGAQDDTVRGGSGDDVLLGWTGNDKMFGDTGNDFLDGEFGNDILRGGSGNDTLQGGSGNDRIIGEGGIDLLIEKGVGFRLTNNRLTGLGIDTLSGIENVYLIGLETDDKLNALDFSAGSVTLEGGEGDDTLIGGTQKNFLSGGNGDDKINGGRDDDSLVGDEGNDLLRGGKGRDTLQGAEGSLGQGEIDTLIGGEGSDIFVVGTQFFNYYDDQLTTVSEGISDYALLEDFNANIDTIKLKGSETYFLEDISLNGVIGTGIYEAKDPVINLDGNFEINRELIALVAGQSAASLTVNSGALFSSIGVPLL